MQNKFSKLSIWLALTAMGVLAQPKRSFEVATAKPAQPVDPAKIAAAFQSGGKVPMGARIDGLRAEYLNLDLKTLLTYAYGVKPEQISGPGWMSTARFDIVAKMPEGSKKEDAPEMLQSLLEERFKLTIRRTHAEHPVLALVVGKGGPKLKASAEKPVAIDESAPLEAGETEAAGPDGLPVRRRIDTAAGSMVTDMGLKGKVSSKANPATQSTYVEFRMVTMAGFADALTLLTPPLDGGTTGQQIVDMTGIEGNFDASFEISLADIVAKLRSFGVDPYRNAPAGAGGPGNTPAASDPGGDSSIMDGLQSMGLKVESRKAMVDQLIVDHAEKTPTEN